MARQKKRLAPGGREPRDIKSTENRLNIANSPPRSSAPEAASFTVYDGAIYRGEVIRRAGRYYAFDPAGAFVGSFSSQLKASRALPRGAA